MALPTTEQAVAAAEQALGRRLPDTLRERLLEENGGQIAITDDEPEVWELFSVWDESSRETMRRSANHIVEAQRSAREWEGFPEHAIAFAEDGGGNYLVLDGERTLLWFHETGETSPVTVDWTAR